MARTYEQYWREEPHRSNGPSRTHSQALARRNLDVRSVGAGTTRPSEDFRQLCDDADSRGMTVELVAGVTLLGTAPNQYRTLASLCVRDTSKRKRLPAVVRAIGPRRFADVARSARDELAAQPRP